MRTHYLTIRKSNSLSGHHLWRLIVNSRQLAHVGLGLIGVWALLTALNGLMMLSAVVGSGEPPGPVLVSVGVPFALILGLSYVLVFHNAKLAEAIASGNYKVVGRDGIQLCVVHGGAVRAAPPTGL